MSEPIKPKILKPQDDLKAVPDSELRELILQTYRAESRHGSNTIHEKGDVGRKNLWVTDLRRCPREIYYKFFEPQKARLYTEKGLVIFADGKLHHQDLQWRIEKVRLADHPGGYLKDPEFNVTGYYDDLIFVGVEDGWKIYDILEIKSKVISGTMEISQDDYDQLQYYIYLAQFSEWLNGKKIKIPAGRLVYKDKTHMSDDVYFCWRVESDEQRQAEIHSHFRWLKEEVIEKRQLCSRPYEYESTECTYCLHRDYCWEGVPIAQKPEFIADESVEPPEQELVDSMAAHYIAMKTEQARITDEVNKAQEILMKYFIATGQERLSANDRQIIRSFTKSTTLDEAYLFDELSKSARNTRQLLNLWKAISVPKFSLLQQAIKDGKLDSELFERAKQVKFHNRLCIKSLDGKEAKDEKEK